MELREYRILRISENMELRAMRVISGALAFSVPFKPGYNSVAVLALAAFWVLCMRKSFAPATMKRILLVSSLFWIAVLGMIYSSNLEEGLFRLQQKLLLLVLPLIFFTTKVDRLKLSRIALSMFVVAVLLACLISITYGVVNWSMHGDASRITSQGLAQFIGLYPYIMALLCLVCQIILLEGKLNNAEIFTWMKNNITLAMLWLFFTAFILLLSVQQIIILWFIVVVVYTFRLVKKTAVAAIIVLAVVSLTIVGVATIPALSEKFSDLVLGSKRNFIPLDDDAIRPHLSEWNGIAIRRAVWTCSMDIIGNHPLIGVGTGDAQDTLQLAYEKRNFYLAALYNRFNAHNQFIQTVVNFGFAGLMIWMLTLGKLFHVYRGNWLFTLTLGCMLLAMITESMLETNKGNLLLAFGLAVFALKTHTSKGEAMPGSSTTSQNSQQ